MEMSVLCLIFWQYMATLMKRYIDRSNVAPLDCSSPHCADTYFFYHLNRLMSWLKVLNAGETTLLHFSALLGRTLNYYFVKILYVQHEDNFTDERLKSFLFSCVLEYDAEAFSEISFLMEVNHFFFILTSMFISYSFIIMFPTPS